mgnify:CR=1 FL=1
MGNVENNGTHFHLDAVQDIGGFSVTNVEKDHYFWVLTRTTITSEHPEFHKYIEQLSNPIFNKVGIFPDAVYQFLIIIHQDLSADLFINDFPVDVEMMAKRDINKGEIITDRDIADIRRLRFPNVKIVKTDKVIYCFKKRWRFGLFFDLSRELDVDAMSLALGTLCRSLSFPYVYGDLEKEPQFEEMIKDGWFPFIEIVGSEYKSLSDAYQNKFHFEDAIDKIVGNFDKERIEKIITKWWRKPVFNDKKKILQAGINAFLSGKDEGYINCLKNLLSEIGGIINLQYFIDTGKGKASFPQLSNYITEKGKAKAGSVSSLLLPLPFLRYLNDVVFSNFDLESGKINPSRHSSSHGVAKAESYTRIKALQAILVLDQIYFYI